MSAMRDAMRWQLLEEVISKGGITEIKLNNGDWLRVIVDANTTTPKFSIVPKDVPPNPAVFAGLDASETY